MTMRTSRKLRSQSRARRPWGSAGLTLVELVIAGTLVSIVALGFSAMHGSSQAFLTQAIQAGDAQGYGAFALWRIVRDIQRGEKVVVKEGSVPQDKGHLIEIDYKSAPSDTTVTKMSYEQKTAGSSEDQKVLWYNLGKPGEGRIITTLYTGNADGNTADPDGLIFELNDQEVTITMRIQRGGSYYEITAKAIPRGANLST